MHKCCPKTCGACQTQTTGQFNTLDILTGQRIKIRNSTLHAANISLASPTLQIQSSRFLSRNGTLKLAATGFKLDTAEIAANNFSGTNLLFGELSEGSVQMRNNNGLEYTATRGSPERCDAEAGSGASAGCDPRAACVNLAEGGVKCTCEQPLRDRSVDGDGSKCEFEGQLLHIFREETAVQMFVRKPHDEHKIISVRAQAEESFDALMSTHYPQGCMPGACSFLRVDGKQSTNVRYLMSSARSSLRKQFKLTVLANETKWPDSLEAQQGLVVVSSPEGRARANGTSRTP